MVICEKCKRLNDCNEGQIFLELKKTMEFSVPECEIYEEKKPELKIIKKQKMKLFIQDYVLDGFKEGYYGYILEFNKRFK